MNKERLIEIGKKMNAQDNRSTQLPLFIVVADESVLTEEGNGERQRIHEDGWNANEMCGYCLEKWQLVEELDEDCDDCDSTMFHWFIIEKHVPQLEHGVFLTGEECDNYIKRRSYAMQKNAISYGISAWRSEEMSKVLEFLSSLGNEDGKAKDCYR